MGYRSRLFIAVVLTFGLASRAFAALDAVSTPLAQETLAAISRGDLVSLKLDLDKKCAGQLADLRTMNVGQTAQFAAYREFAQFFCKVRPLTSTQAETLRWLVTQPNLMPTLMSAVSDADEPARVLDVLNRLHQTSPDLDQYAELATAITVVWDKPPEKDATRHVPVFDQTRGPRLFTYFTSSSLSPQIPIHSLPWELAVYMVDLRISEAEITWAAQRYRNRGDVSSSYFDVEYDQSVYFEGAKKKIDAIPYTLQNILAVGGVCTEQAHFATEIAKALGIPACMCTSIGGGSGQCGHAWMGFLQKADNRISWNFERGRYKEDLFWSADITDPQTHERLTDADVGLLSEFSRIAKSDRLASALILKLVDQVEPSRRLQFLIKVIDLSPANRLAWLSMARLGTVTSVTPAQADMICLAVKRLLVTPYPDFACQILINLATSQSQGVEVAGLNAFAGYFPQRPDLRARIRLRQAYVLHEMGSNDQAMQRLGEVLTQDLNAGPIILLALMQCEKLLPGPENLPHLLRIYSEVWPKISKPDRSAAAYGTPYYLIGRQFLMLLEKSGNHVTAGQVRDALEKVYPSKIAVN